MAPPEKKPSVRFVDTAAMPDPQYWSHAVSLKRSGHLIFTSGLVGQYPDGKFPETFNEQVKVAFTNLEKSLQAAGASMRDVVKLTFYPVDWSMANAKELFEPYVQAMVEEYGFTRRPLTTTVPVANLGYPEAKFEIEAVAAMGGAGTAFLGPSVAIEHPPPPVKVDVVVVGGGFSGTQAAYDVEQAGLSCVLLEARHRIGGRSYSKKLRSGPGMIELGATWINETTQPKAYALTQKFGLDCVKQYETGDVLWQTSDKVTRRLKDGDMMQFGDPEKLMVFGALSQALEEGYESFDLRKPSEAPEELNLSVTDWINKKVGNSPFAHELGNHMVGSLVGREPHEVGIHYILDYCKSGGGLDAIGGEGKYGAQSLKIRQGTSAIATSLAGAMKPGSVLLNSPVDEITQKEDGVLVTTLNGTSYNARKIILAVPTNTYAKIHFSPPLPEEKKSLVSRTMGGVYAKIILTYSAAWWRDLGLCGKFSSLVGPICFSWEISDPTVQQYSLAIFVSGTAGQAWALLSSLAKEEAVINHLAELVGPEHAHLAKDVLEVNYVEWHKEEYIDGAPTCAMGPGILSKYGHALREPFGNVHIAGGETAYEWKGFLEGALHAGSRAAEEVVTLLKLQPTV